MIGEQVTIHRYTPGATDAHGNPGQPTWTDVVVSGAAVSPRQGEERGNARDAVIVGLTVYLPPGTQVGAMDQMTVREARYGVIGEPGVWRNPFTGLTRGVQVALERVEG